MLDLRLREIMLLALSHRERLSMLTYYIGLVVFSDSRNRLVKMQLSSLRDTDFL